MDDERNGEGDSVERQGSAACGLVHPPGCAPRTTRLVLDQCVTVADCIVNGRSAVWPPSEADLRVIAAITSSYMENLEYSEARVEPQPRSPIPSSTSSCLAPSSAASASTMCFVPETPPSWQCASPPRDWWPSCPGRPWQGHLELIWKLETDDGVELLGFPLRGAPLPADIRHLDAGGRQLGSGIGRSAPGSAVTGLLLSVR